MSSRVKFWGRTVRKKFISQHSQKRTGQKPTKTQHHNTNTPLNTTNHTQQFRFHGRRHRIFWSQTRTKRRAEKHYSKQTSLPSAGLVWGVPYKTGKLHHNTTVKYRKQKKGNRGDIRRSNLPLFSGHPLQKLQLDWRTCTLESKPLFLRRSADFTPAVLDCSFCCCCWK